MKRMIGRINLDRELSYTQAQKLLQFFSSKPENKPYKSIPLEIISNGRAIQWNKNEDIDFVEIVIADTIQLLKKYKIRAIGILKVTGPKKMCFEIIILRDRVKVYDQGQIRDVNPTT